MKTLDWLIARLKEPSTHAVIASFLATFGATTEAAEVGNIALGVATVFGVLGLAMREKGGA
ncbi:MAG: hypothetical protein AB7F67_04045 [Rhodospirillaceae bacterium]